MGYQQLLVWRESYALAKSIYALTKRFPDSERYGLISQMRRSSVSIPSNLAEGSRRDGPNEMKHFCSIAYGSASELEVQLMLAKDVQMAEAEYFSDAETHLRSVLRLLNLFRRSLK